MEKRRNEKEHFILNENVKLLLHSSLYSHQSQATRSRKLCIALDTPQSITLQPLHPKQQQQQKIGNFAFPSSVFSPCSLFFSFSPDSEPQGRDQDTTGTSQSFPPEPVEIQRVPGQFLLPILFPKVTSCWEGTLLSESTSTWLSPPPSEPFNCCLILMKCGCW